MNKNNCGYFEVEILLPKGKYQIKFIVDGLWKCSSNIIQEKDARGIKNNIIEVKEIEVPESLKTSQKKMYISNEINIEPNKRGNNKFNDNHWSKKLLNMKNNQEKDDDNLYRLNVRQAAAWNENDINNVPYNGESKRIVEIFI